MNFTLLQLIYNNFWKETRHMRRSREKNIFKLLPPQSPRGLSALTCLYYLARPTKTAMLRRLMVWCLSSLYVLRHQSIWKKFQWQHGTRHTQTLEVAHNKFSAKKVSGRCVEEAPCGSILVSNHLHCTTSRKKPLNFCILGCRTQEVQLYWYHK